MTAADPIFEARDTVWRRYAAIGIILAFGVTFTLFWLYSAMNDPSEWLDLGLILLGPCVLAWGIWVYRRPFPRRLRIQLDADGITVWPDLIGSDPVMMTWDALQAVSTRTIGFYGRYLYFEGDGRTMRMNAHELECDRIAVVAQVAAVLVNKGRTLQEDPNSTWGGKVKYWHVRDD